jgi:hypothetical protein
MINSERKQPVTQRAMAWRAVSRGHAPPRLNFEILRFVALVLPLVVGGALVATLRRGTGWSSPLVPTLGTAIICAAGIIYNIDSRQRLRPVRAAIRIAATTRPGIFAPVAIICGLGAALLTVDAEQPVLAGLLWGAGIALLLAHALFLERPRLTPPTPIDAGALIGLVALALLLRLPYLADLPSFVHSDEAQMGLYTRLAAQGAMPSLFSTTDWWSVPWLGPALQAPLLLFFGEGLTALRLASVLAGVLATAGLWFLGSELWSRRAGFVAALLFAVLAPSVHFSRDGVHYMQSIAALVWTVLCYTRATKRYSGAYAALTGVLIGIDVQLYYAARLAVPLVFLHAAICAALERGLLRNWLRLICWTALGLVVTFLPFGAYYLAHPASFAQRTDAVAIFSRTSQVRAALTLDYRRAGWLEILGRQVQRVVLGFLAMGDRSQQYGATTPLLDPITAALLPAACAVALARIRQTPWLLCVLWTAITITLGGILTTGQPDAPRLLAALPAICLLIGGLAHTLLIAAGDTGLRDAKPLLAIALASALVATAVANTDTYLDTYPATAAAQPVTLITDIGRYLSTVPGTTPVVLYDQRQFYLAHWTIQLLAPQIHGTTVWDQQGLDAALAASHGPYLLITVNAPTTLIDDVVTQYRGGRLMQLPVHAARTVVMMYQYNGAGIV